MIAVTKKLIKYNFTANANKPYFIVIHDTGNKSVGANADAHYRYFNGGERGASAHYFVDDHAIVQVVEVKDRSWHCGDGGGKYGVANSNSIGIEMCINSDGNYAATLKNTIDITVHLMKSYGIPIEKVVRHYDASRKNCPQTMNNGTWTKWIEFKDKVNAQFKAPVAPLRVEVIYRVRKTWADAGSQIGAYKVLDSAKELATKNVGYSVFDDNGKMIYAPAPIVTIATTIPKLPIMGITEFSIDQLGTMLLKRNGTPKINGMNIIEFVKLYIEEGQAEGVRGDIAFCQSILETNSFKYGGDVLPEQNNYSGIGTTGGGVRGNEFSSQRIGVRAQIQHLKAYGSTLPLVNPNVDPRFQYVTRGSALNFGDLAGKWASDKDYGVKIYNLYSELKSTVANAEVITSYIQKDAIEKIIEVPVEKIVEVKIKLNLSNEERALLETAYSLIGKILKGAS